MTTKIAVLLRPGDQITLYGQRQTVISSEMPIVGRVHLTTDTTPAGNAWVLDCDQPVTVHTAA